MTPGIAIALIVGRVILIDFPPARIKQISGDLFSGDMPGAARSALKCAGSPASIVLWSNGIALWIC
jgi:hypothetical protein